MIGDHAQFHENEKTFIANTKLENAVKARVMKDGRCLKDIFDEECSKYIYLQDCSGYCINGLLYDQRYPESNLTYHAVVRTLQRVKASVHPANPSSFDEVIQLLMKHKDFT